MTTQLFGEPVQRVEDDRLLRGHGTLPRRPRRTDALEAAFVRSPHAHARIVDIDVAAALDVEGVLAVYTYEDLDRPAGRAAAAADPAPGR